MKKNKVLLQFALITSFLITFQSCKSTINISNYTVPNCSDTNYLQNQEVPLSLSLIETGFAITSEAFIFKGGRLFKKRKLSHTSVLIQHPKGTFVFDTGLGSEIEGQFHDHFSFLERQMFKFTKSNSLKENLIKHNFNPDSIDFIIPSHLHFDHASGIEDFKNPQVWITKTEYDHAFSHKASAPAFIKEQYDADFIRWKLIDFNLKPYEIFNESYDVFEDGSVILVKLPGHTKGSIGMFVNLTSGKRYFFTGDLTWAAEAFINPAEKHFIPRRKVDGDPELVREYIVKIHHLLYSKPTLIVVPAHDFNAQKKIAHFPELEF